jgi:hypothetical protein
MAAKFLEAFANHGVDETATAPGMIVPFQGSNIVTLTGGKGIQPVLDKTGHVKIAEINRTIFSVFSVMSDAEPSTVPVPADARIFRIDGHLPGKTDLVAGKATLAVRVLKPRSVKIAIRPVQVRDKNGSVVFHSKRKFDIPELVQKMNQIWTVQANVVFKLVSADPIFVDDEVAIAKALDLKAERAPLPELVNMADFVKMFDGFKDQSAEMTFFLFGKVGDRPVGGRGPGVPVDGITIRSISPIAFISDLRNESTMAHEAGHLLGYSGHVDPPNARHLMNDGGPGFGLGKILFRDVVQKFNKQ